MGAFLTLIATCVVMFVAAMGAGMVPLHQATLLPSLGSQSSIMSSSSTSMPIDSNNLAVVSAVGAGLLISTALAVVVPEGFHLLAAIERKAAVVVAIEEEHESMSSSSGSHDHHSHSDHSSGHSHLGGGDAVPHWLPGLALASGFFFMMGLDALSASSSGGHQSCGGVARSISGTATAATTMEGGSGGASAAANAAAAPPTSSAAASGALRALVVHAAADGLAVGASCAATATATGPGAQTLAWSVAAAMALHKAPAAFGLSATLASAGWGQLRARRGLLFFSLSSPVAALATFSALLIFGGGREHAAGSGSGLGVAAALLFSGGTLVHAAAVHVLPSVAPRLGFSSSPSESCEEEETSARVRYALVAGAAAPLLLSALAPHEH